jgi:DNA-binding transcriptional LysR family regulator
LLLLIIRLDGKTLLTKTGELSGSMLPANDMMLFVDVVRNKNFSTAAKKHGITPAAVSKRIANLEAHLEVRLLNRTTRNISLTEAGNILFSHCEKLYTGFEEAHAAILDAQSEPKGNIRISAPTNFCNLILAPILAKFAHKHPSITIDVFLDDNRKMPPVGDYDLAIRAGALEDSTAISRKLYHIKFAVCGSAEYFHLHPKPQHPDDLRQHNCIDYNYREGGQIWSFFVTTRPSKI